MKCPKCGTMMGYDENARAWVCYLRSCGNELTAKEIPALVAQRDALVAEVKELRAELYQEKILHARAEGETSEAIYHSTRRMGQVEDMAAENAKLRGLLDESIGFVTAWANGHGHKDDNGNDQPNAIAMRLAERIAKALK